MTNDNENKNSDESIKYRYLENIADYVNLVILESKEICIGIEFPDSIPVAIPWPSAWDLSLIIGSFARQAQSEEENLIEEEALQIN